MGLTKGSTGSSLIFNEKSGKDINSQYEIGLAGNPNVGKSTLFNLLTGLKQHTGNWPGKTVSNARGIYEYRESIFEVVDIPGTYSLLSNSEEEKIARNYICFGSAKILVVVCDATSLERNLNLFFQIKEVCPKVILCINMIDEAKKNGISIDLNGLIKQIGSQAIFISAREDIGTEVLKMKIKEEIEEDNISEKILRYDFKIELAIKKASEILRKYSYISDKIKLRWVSLRLIEGNINIKDMIVKHFKISLESLEKINIIRNELNESYNKKDIQDVIVETIVKRAEKISSEVVRKEDKKNNFRDGIDKILVSKLTGIPIMIFMLLIILWITIALSNYPSQLLSKFFSILENYIRESTFISVIPPFLSGMLVDGIYITLAWVIAVMLPPMAIFFPLFTLLEDSGYLPRVAFNLDKCFKKCSSCGKQALTMCMGLGCNAAGVVGCRVINSPKERMIAILTNVFMPCNGRFPIIITVASIFIGGSLMASVTVTIAIMFGVVITLIISKILSMTILKGMKSDFMLELPPIRKPQICKVLVRSLVDRTLYVLGRAILIAAPAGVVIWIFANIHIRDTTILYMCASTLEPFANAIGLDGYILMAFILGFPANEIIIPIIIMSYMRSKTLIEIDNVLELKSLLVQNGWTILTAINILILTIMHYPCGTTLWTIKKETGSFKWAILAFIIPTICGVSTCFLVTNIWRRFI